MKIGLSGANASGYQCRHRRRCGRRLPARPVPLGASALVRSSAGRRNCVARGQIVCRAGRCGPNSQAELKNARTSSAMHVPSTNSVVAAGNAVLRIRKKCTLSGRPFSSQCARFQSLSGTSIIVLLPERDIDRDRPSKAHLQRWRNGDHRTRQATCEPFAL